MLLKLEALSEPVIRILSAHPVRLLPLTRTGARDEESARVLNQFPLETLFPSARHPEAALSGLLLLLGYWDKSHEVSQDIPSAEGSYWHGIVHRMEPDPGNAGYWFRHVGNHPIFPELTRRASEILKAAGQTDWKLKAHWDPFLFIDWFEAARRKPGSESERVAIEIQQAEWELLFGWCARRAQD